MNASVWLAVPVLPLLAWVGLNQQRPAPAAGPLAYVSAQRISAETTEGKAGLARVQALQRERTADVRTKQQALETTRRQLTTAQADARTRLQTQEQQQRSELELAIARAQADIQSTQRQVSADLLAKVRTVVGEVVKGRDTQVVLNLETAVVWAAPRLDLTDAVIAHMNATPAPAPK